MKALLIKYKTVIKFIITFLVVYSVLSLLYKFYLQCSDGVTYYPDYFTYEVSKQAEALLHVIGYDARVLPHESEPSMKMLVNGRYLARIIEGCNAISVIILFVSFVIAFTGPLKATLLYAFSGSVLIYVVNLIRIVVLVLGVYHYPEQEDILHKVIFPGIIYGTVFLLWVFWVNRFSKLKQHNA